MDRRITPPRRVTSPTWGPPHSCKQALKTKGAETQVRRSLDRGGLDLVKGAGNQTDRNPICLSYVQHLLNGVTKYHCSVVI